VQAKGNTKMGLIVKGKAAKIAVGRLLHIAKRKSSSSDVWMNHPTSIFPPMACSRLGLDPSTNLIHAPLVYHENYSFDDWPKTHTFPMDKFRQLAQYLTNPTREESVLGGDVLSAAEPLVQSYQDFFRPLDLHQIPNEWIQQPTGPIEKDYLQKFLTGSLSRDQCRRIGFREQTYRPELIERTLLEVAGTVLTCQLALQYGIASNLAGGTHHATYNYGSGYTILNDLAIASNYLTNPIFHKQDFDSMSSSNNSDATTAPVALRKTVLIIDCDVHQGDGTAKFTSQGIIPSERMVTLSIHCQDNYPFPKATSTYDVGLPSNIRDEDYLEAVQLSVTRALNEWNPDFVLYDAGVDIYENDSLGKFCISTKGIRQRDRWILDTCVTKNIPVAAVIGGGYDKNPYALAQRHAILHEECAYIWRTYKMWMKSSNNPIYQPKYYHMDTS
jgi:acetoin utilization deacetylase AcuC-like enzyme